MANALIRRKTTTKPAPKPMSTVKGPKGSLGVEFRWSTSINQLNLIDLDSNTPQKSVLSFASTKISNPSTVSREKLSPTSPRLPSSNDPNKKNKLAVSTEEDTTTHQMSPLSLTYAQLYHGDLSSRYKKKSQSQTSLLPPLNNNNKRNSFSYRRSNVNQAPPTNNPDKYIRLPIAQLRRLHVSSKYIKEAKKLYFNAATKVFVPRHAIVEMV